jgi:hypothetical protein
MIVKRDFILDPSFALYLPLYELDGASFMSRDAHGHLATVSGALWTPQGRSFDGVDDIIELVTFDLDASKTVIAWVKPSSSCPDARAVIFSRYVALINTIAAPVRALSHYNGTDYLNSTGLVTWDVWNHVTYVFHQTDNKIYFYINAVASGSGDSPQFTQTFLYIGGWGPGFFQFKGIMGEVCLCNRALTPLEIRQNYLATKWRYR